MRKTLTFAFAGLVVCHFGLMAIGMSKVSVRQDHWAVKAARLYAQLTGAGNGFGFFSPNIPRQIFIDFDVTRASGRTEHLRLQDTASADVALRIGNMIRMMTKAFRDKRIYRSLAASLTAAIYKRYPDARDVTIHASIYDFPDMSGYRRGQRPRKVEFYSAKFTRRS